MSRSCSFDAKFLKPDYSNKAKIIRIATVALYFVRSTIKIFLTPPYCARKIRRNSFIFFPRNIRRMIGNGKIFSLASAEKCQVKHERDHKFHLKTGLNAANFYESIYQYILIFYSITTQKKI